MQIKRLFQTILPALLLALTLLACDAVPRAAGPVEGTLEVHFIDVGQADAALLLCGGESMLIDGGNVADSSLVVSYLGAHGVETLTYAVDTHAHEDHVGGLSGALAKYGAGTVYAPVEEYDSKAFRDFVKYAGALTIPAPGDSWSLGTATVTVLGPVAEYGAPNDTSLVLRVDFGETSFLFTGDMERGAEGDLLDAGADLEATVLKAGHHGSDTSTSYPFLRAVAPQYAVLSVGEGNSYGHPSEAVLSRFRDAEVQVWRTDMQGSIVAVSDGAEVTFTPERNPGAQTNPTQARAPVTYIGNANSKVFHTDGCTALPALKNQVELESREAALAEGFTPCGRCKP